MKPVKYIRHSITVKCDYCGNDAIQVPGSKIYPHRKDLHNNQFYECEPCKAYVGCHANSNKPLGRLANAELRLAKSTAHAAFDPFWQDGQLTRSKAYTWLGRKLGLTHEACHIGKFDLERCNQVIDICRAERGRRF